MGEITTPSGHNRQSYSSRVVEGATPKAGRENRRAIPVGCGTHGGPQGFTNLVVERKPNGDIIFDPHVTGGCVIIFDEAAAATLFDLLGTWLGGV